MKTKKLAKKLSLEVWEYLRDHPEIGYKRDIPYNLFLKINNSECRCPLCELFYDITKIDHKDCPLINCGKGSDYRNWLYSKSNEERAKYAGLIVDKIKAWDIEND